MPFLPSRSRPKGVTSTQVEPTEMTGTGDDAIRRPSQATRSSSMLASVSSAGLTSGSVRPEKNTKSRPGSSTAASSAWSIAVSADVRWLARK